MSSVLLLLCLFLASTNASWYHCANDGAGCTVSGRRNMRYGTGNRWSFGQVEGTTVKCGHAMFGDPAPGIAKECWVSNAKVSNTETWTECASEGQWCYFLGDRLVRYGLNGKYFYAEGMGGVPCAWTELGGDPNPGVVKKCWYGPKLTSDSSWTRCADDPYNCKVPASNAIYKIRYGVSGGNWNIRNFAADQVACTTSYFRDWDHGVHKYCEFNQAPAQFFNPTGLWRKATSCGSGTTCVYTLSFGVDSTTSESTTNTWSSTLSSVTQIGIGFDSQTLSSSVSHNVTTMQQSAYSTHVTQSCSAKCNFSPAVLWQWIMKTGEVNLPGSGGTTSIDVPFTTFACAYECLKSSTAVPKCPPGYCVPNTDCQRCSQSIF